MTDQPEKCPECGGLLETGKPCPNCLLKMVSEPTDQIDADLDDLSIPIETTDGKSKLAFLNIAIDIEAVRTAFPQLEIIEMIGRGGMGTVFKARQPKLDRYVALKILAADLADKPTFADRFAREGKLLARLSHPNIVSVYDYGQSDAIEGYYYYLILEYVDGVNLRQAMKERQFTPEQALSIVPKICDALQYAHDEGVLHRDIKPENILLDTRGRIKITDFGIGKLTEQNDIGDRSISEEKSETPNLTNTGQILGTPNYMAPEQMDAPNTVDHRADIYSLGVVFYELLTGELPKGRFPLPSEKTPVDAQVDEIVLKAMERERDKRYQSAEEMKTSVETATNISPKSRMRSEAELPGALSAHSAAPPPSSASLRMGFLVVLSLLSCLIPFFVVHMGILNDYTRWTSGDLIREESSIYEGMAKTERPMDKENFKSLLERNRSEYNRRYHQNEVMIHKIGWSTGILSGLAGMFFGIRHLVRMRRNQNKIGFAPAAFAALFPPGVLLWLGMTIYLMDHLGLDEIWLAVPPLAVLGLLLFAAWLLKRWVDPKPKRAKTSTETTKDKYAMIPTKTSVSLRSVTWDGMLFFIGYSVLVLLLPAILFALFQGLTYRTQDETNAALAFAVGLAIVVVPAVLLSIQLYRTKKRGIPIDPPPEKPRHGAVMLSFSLAVLCLIAGTSAAVYVHDLNVEHQRLWNMHVEYHQKFDEIQREKQKLRNQVLSFNNRHPKSSINLRLGDIDFTYNGVDYSEPERVIKDIDTWFDRERETFALREYRLPIVVYSVFLILGLAATGMAWLHLDCRRNDLSRLQRMGRRFALFAPLCFLVAVLSGVVLTMFYSGSCDFQDQMNLGIRIINNWIALPLFCAYLVLLVGLVVYPLVYCRESIKNFAPIYFDKPYRLNMAYGVFLASVMLVIPFLAIAGRDRIQFDAFWERAGDGVYDRWKDAMRESDSRPIGSLDEGEQLLYDLNRLVPQYMIFFENYQKIMLRDTDGPLMHVYKFFGRFALIPLLFVMAIPGGIGSWFGWRCLLHFDGEQRWWESVLAYCAAFLMPGFVVWCLLALAIWVPVSVGNWGTQQQFVEAATLSLITLLTLVLVGGAVWKTYARLRKTT